MRQVGDSALAAALAGRATELLPAAAGVTGPTAAAAQLVRGKALLAVPMLDAAREILTPLAMRSVEAREALSECRARIRARDVSNRTTARLMLSYMRAEGVHAPM